MLRAELGHLQVDDDVAVQFDVVEEDVDEEVLLADREVVLAAEEGEADAELEHDVLEVAQEAALQVALVGSSIEGEEVEVVGVFEQALGEVGLGGGERAGEVGDGLALAAMERGVDLDGQDVAAPAVLDGGLGVPGADFGGAELVEQDAVVEPGQLCSNLLQNCLVRPGRGESPHVPEVPGREALHPWKLVPQVA